MGTDGGLFRTFQRDNKPLSLHLDKVAFRPRYYEIQAFELELERPTGELVDELVAKSRIAGPSVIGVEKGSSRSGSGEQRPTGHWTSLGTNRHYVVFGIGGDIDLLEHWPDRAGASLTPIDVFDDDSHLGRPDTAIPFDPERALEAHRRHQTYRLWVLGMRDKDGPRGLYTFTDLTDADEQAVLDGQLDSKATVDENFAAVAPIIDAIHVQTEEYFAKELPSKLAEAIEERRRWLGARKAVRDSLDWGQDWRFEIPKLEEVPASETVADIATSALLEVDHSRRLSPASFDDVQRTIRVWVDAVEHYPAAFVDLYEDRLSDLLAATLNASLPGASREVYSRGGKSDIYIKADALSTGAKPVAVFIAESKWWNGAKEAQDALKQLFLYLQVRDTSALLLFFIDPENPDIYRNRAIEALKETPGFVSAEEGAVEGWPVLTYTEGGRTVNVCVATVFLPPLSDEEVEKAKRRHRNRPPGSAAETSADESES